MHLKVVKLSVIPHFQLLDDDGVVVDECTAQPVTMFPGKFIDFGSLVERVEKSANEDKASIEKMRLRALW